MYYSEDFILDYESLEDFSYKDLGDAFITLYFLNEFVGYVEVWTDPELEEEYIIINYEIIYLYTLKRN